MSRPDASHRGFFMPQALLRENAWTTPLALAGTLEDAQALGVTMQLSSAKLCDSWLHSRFLHPAQVVDRVLRFEATGNKNHARP